MLKSYFNDDQIAILQAFHIDSLFEHLADYYFEYYKNDEQLMADAYDIFITAILTAWYHGLDKNQHKAIADDSINKLIITIGKAINDNREYHEREDARK